MSNNQILIALIIAACFYFWYRSHSKLDHKKKVKAVTDAYQGSPGVLFWHIKDTGYVMAVEVLSTQHAQTIVNTLNIHTVQDVHVQHMGKIVLTLAPSGLLVPNIDVRV